MQAVLPFGQRLRGGPVLRREDAAMRDGELLVYERCAMPLGKQVLRRRLCRGAVLRRLRLWRDRMLQRIGELLQLLPV